MFSRNFRIKQNILEQDKINNSEAKLRKKEEKRLRKAARREAEERAAEEREAEEREAARMEAARREVEQATNSTNNIPFSLSRTTMPWPSLTDNMPFVFGQRPIGGITKKPKLFNKRKKTRRYKSKKRKTKIKKLKIKFFPK